MTSHRFQAILSPFSLSVHVLFPSVEGEGTSVGSEEGEVWRRKEEGEEGTQRATATAKLGGGEDKPPPPHKKNGGLEFSL